MRVRLNGSLVELKEPLSLTEFLALHQIAGKIAVALNEEIARVDSWPETMVREGDRIEVVHAVQGG